MSIHRDTCAECGAWKKAELIGYDAVRLDNGRNWRLMLCGRCLRDRGAAWRTRWRIRGRTLPEAP